MLEPLEAVGGVDSGAAKPDGSLPRRRRSSARAPNTRLTDVPGRGATARWRSKYQLEAGGGVEDEVHQPDSSRASATISAPLTVNSTGVSVRREASQSAVSRARCAQATPAAVVVHLDHHGIVQLVSAGDHDHKGSGADLSARGVGRAMRSVDKQSGS